MSEPQRKPDADGADEEPGDASGDAPAADEISGWEWGVAAVGLLLVLAALAFTITDAVRGGTAPPAIVVQVDSVMPVAGGYLVLFRAANDGDEAAGEVTIVGDVAGSADGARAPERSTAVLDYLPARSTRTGGLFFRSEPRPEALSMRALGYQSP